jgi:hypothetical protein
MQEIIVMSYQNHKKIQKYSAFLILNDHDAMINNLKKSSYKLTVVLPSS